jgi:flagellar biosynthesis protein FlhA
LAFSKHLCPQQTLLRCEQVQHLKKFAGEFDICQVACRHVLPIANRGGVHEAASSAYAGTQIGEILSRDDVKELVENVRKTSPAVVEELIPDKLGYGELQAVLRNLLREGVGVRNKPAILEVLADHVGKTKDLEALGELVRQRLGRALCELHADRQGTIHAVTLDPEIESRLAAAVGSAPNPELPPVSPAYLQRLVEKIGESVGRAARGGTDVVLLARSSVRRFLGELVRASLPKLAVLSYNEVVPARGVETMAIVKLED